MFGVQINFRLNLNVTRITHLDQYQHPLQPMPGATFATTHTNDPQDLSDIYTDSSPIHPAPSGIPPALFLPPQSQSGSIELLEIPLDSSSSSSVPSVIVAVPTPTPPDPDPPMHITSAVPVTYKKQTKRRRSFWRRRHQQTANTITGSATATGSLFYDPRFDSNNNKPQAVYRRLFNTASLRRGLSKITTQFAPGVPV